MRGQERPREGLAAFTSHIKVLWRDATENGDRGRHVAQSTPATGGKSMRSIMLAVLALTTVASLPAAEEPERLRAGATLMATQVYSLADDRKVLKAFEGLRVADVSD